eukprot:4472815-Prymnesium_polylepis.2
MVLAASPYQEQDGDDECSEEADELQVDVDEKKPPIQCIALHQRNHLPKVESRLVVAMEERCGVEQPMIFLIFIEEHEAARNQQCDVENDHADRPDDH